MSEPLPRPDAVASSAWGKALERACAFLAVLGGLLFLCEALMSVASVLGRIFLSTPISGDYELVQLMSAMGIAMCLPYCQIKRGHVFVDFFTLWAPAPVKRYMDAFASLVLAGCAFLLAWRCWEGMVEMHEYGETTMVISMPVWWGYVPLMPSFVLFGLAALMAVVQDLRPLNNEREVQA
ncbi:TRAP transporter small permease [Kerstersia gyiorum]|uniref:TRAP transporter small permease n=1 Tax=Kerstersia gyiorum TaxID=206506 RepID=UPI001070D65F|nr:TRAP transporter small permease [Kerstersia gyiorum]QBR41359.1 TRAP transporter small permease [Kerstersia gyiorum]